MSKGTTIISDLRSFFSENEKNRAINAIMRVMGCINIRPEQIGTEKKENSKFTNVQVLNLLVLFPFFVVRNAYRYSGSSLSRLFCCEKDMFYRFMNDGNIKWRKLLYAMNLQLLRKIRRSTEAEHDRPVCLIIDDTDAPKSGRKSELIGKVFSHLEHKTILGYKCLTLLLSDGMSQLFLDFSLHGEEGSKPDKKQGLTDKQRKARYSKDHSGEAVEERIKEYTMSKIDETIGALFREATTGTLELSASDRIWELILDTMCLIMALNTIRIWIEIVKKRFSFFFQRSYLVTHELARKIIERLCGCKFIRSQEIQLILVIPY